MQQSDQRLESVMETVVSIPFGGSDGESDSQDDELDDETLAGPSFPCKIFTPPECTSRDLPDGPRLRMKTYHGALDLCRDRIREILRKIHEPTIGRVVDVVQSAYERAEEDRLMPYTELRAVAISGIDRSATSSVLIDIQQVLTSNQIECRDEMEGVAREKDSPRLRSRVLVSMLTSTDCSNLTSAMKALISGFLEYALDDEDSPVHRSRSMRSLAPYDINLLKNWYERLRQSREQKDLPKLVIFVTELERIEPAILKDIFYICRLHVPRLPFVFVLGLSSPATPSYIHSAFTRRTLALLQLTRVEVASGIDVLERVLRDTFFHPEFEPEVTPSPAVLSFLFEQYTQSVQSIDFLISLLQLIHLRHFIDPMSTLTVDELVGMGDMEDTAKKLSAPSGLSFLRVLLARLRHSEKSSEDTFTSGRVGDDEVTPRKQGGKPKGRSKTTAANGTDFDHNLALQALNRVREIRQSLRERLRRSRLAFIIVSEIRRQLLAMKKLRETSGDRGRHGGVVGTEMDLMCSWLRGTVPGKQGKVIKDAIQTIDANEVEKLLRAVQELLNELSQEPTQARDTLMEIFEDWRVRFYSADANPDSDAGSDEQAEVHEELSQWFSNYIKENAFDVTENELWDIWFTGNPTGIFEIFNPAPRAAIINALVHPERYLCNKDTVSANNPPPKGKGKARADDRADSDSEELTPDTALLFKGYLKSGRMVNVYDWYTSFKEGLDSRRRSENRAINKSSRARTRGKKDRQKAMRNGSINGSAPPSPTKGRGRGGRRRDGMSRGQLLVEPGSASSTDESETDDKEMMSPEDRERWEAEVQARFIRSVQELDLLGFIKHTGRKADHVQKTVYELPDYA